MEGERASSSLVHDGQPKYEGRPHSDITEKIIGAAYEVHRELGGGFLEKVYENALAIELRRRGLGVKTQAGIAVRYKGEVVGNLPLTYSSTMRSCVKSKQLNR